MSQCANLTLGSSTQVLVSLAEQTGKSFLDFSFTGSFAQGIHSVLWCEKSSVASPREKCSCEFVQENPIPKQQHLPPKSRLFSFTQVLSSLRTVKFKRFGCKWSIVLAVAYAVGHTRQLHYAGSSNHSTSLCICKHVCWLDLSTKQGSSPSLFEL